MLEMPILDVILVQAAVDAVTVVVLAVKSFGNRVGPLPERPTRDKVINLKATTQRKWCGSRALTISADDWHHSTSLIDQTDTISRANAAISGNRQAIAAAFRSGTNFEPPHTIFGLSRMFASSTWFLVTSN